VESAHGRTEPGVRTVFEAVQDAAAVASAPEGRSSARASISVQRLHTDVFTAE